MAKLVNWYNFSKTLQAKKIMLFNAADVQRLFRTSKVATDFLLYRYTKKGFIIRLKRGLYSFPDAAIPEPYIANRLYEPSYVSLEFALAYYGIIPEIVYEITSVTPKATCSWKVCGKIYSYRRIKQSVFGGYTIVQQQGYSFAMAEPAKALVDAHYFRILDGLKPLARLNKKKINTARALQYAKSFANKKLAQTINNLLT